MNGSSIMGMIPRYQRLRLELSEYLSGLPVGAKTFTEHELVKRYKVSRVTARKALEELRKDGTLESQPGRGTFLAKAIARAQVNQAQTKFISLLVPSGQTTKIGEIVEGAEAEASRRGYHLVIAHDHNDPKRQLAQLEKMIESQTAGLLLFPDRFAPELKKFPEVLQLVKQRHVPLVLLDRYLPGLECPCVMTDNVKGFHEITEHLICCGRRRLALIGFWPNNTVHIARRKGFTEALRDYNLKPEPILEAEITGTTDFFQAAHDAVAGWIKGKTTTELPFDAIVCMFDILAYGAYAALQAAGLRVPEDVALVGYDNLDSELYRGLGLELTSVQQPLALEGETAARLLIDQIEGKPRANRANHVLLPPKLVVRTSGGERRSAVGLEA